MIGGWQTNLSTAKFIFDGEKLDPKTTPASLDLEDEDECQIGACASFIALLLPHFPLNPPNRFLSHFSQMLSSEAVKVAHRGRRTRGGSCGGGIWMRLPRAGGFCCTPEWGGTRC